MMRVRPVIRMVVPGLLALEIGMTSPDTENCPLTQSLEESVPADWFICPSEDTGVSGVDEVTKKLSEWMAARLFLRTTYSCITVALRGRRKFSSVGDVSSRPFRSSEQEDWDFVKRWAWLLWRRTCPGCDKEFWRVTNAGFIRFLITRLSVS